MIPFRLKSILNVYKNNREKIVKRVKVLINVVLAYMFTFNLLN